MSEVIQDSIECYNSVVQNDDVHLLDILFTHNGPTSLQCLGNRIVIGLQHPIRGVDGISEYQDTDNHLVGTQLDSLVYDSRLLIDLPEDISCRLADETRSVAKEPAVGEQAGPKRLRLTTTHMPPVEDQEPGLNEYLTALFRIYSWTLENTGTKYASEIFGGLVQGVLHATIDHGTSAIDCYRDETVKLLLHEVGRDPSDVLDLIEKEYQDRVLDCVRQVLHYSVPNTKSELEKIGLRVLLEKAQERARRYQTDAIRDSIEHFKDLLEDAEPRQIERVFNSTDRGYPPFVFVDVVEQALLFSKASRDWMVGPHLSAVGFQIDDGPEPNERNAWSDAIRELIMAGLHLSAKVASEFSRCLAATLGSIITGSRSSVWIQRIMEWESSNFYGGDTGLTDAYRHYFSRLHGVLFPKPEENKLRLLKSSDGDWTARALHTLRHGFLLNGFQESADLIGKYLDTELPNILATSQSVFTTDAALENKRLQTLKEEEKLAEIHRYQEDETYEISAKLKRCGKEFWDELIAQAALKRLRGRFVSALISAALNAQVGDYKAALLNCLLAAEEEINVVFRAYRYTHQSVEHGTPPSNNDYKRTFDKLAGFMDGEKLDFGSMVFILNRIWDKKMSDRGENLATQLAEFISSKGSEFQLKMAGELLFKKRDRSEKYNMIDLRNEAAHSENGGPTFDEDFWDGFLKRFLFIINTLVVVRDFEKLISTET